MTIDYSIVIYHLVMKIIDVAMASKGKIALLFKQDFLFFQTIKWASRRVQQSIAQKVQKRLNFCGLDLLLTRE